MAYSDETVNSKLNTLMETQESICTTANWIIYYRYVLPTTAALKASLTLVPGAMPKPSPKSGTRTSRALQRIRSSTSCT
jgi:hypothetical protein